MAPQTAILPSSEFRAGLRKRGGDTAARCFQCATCTSVCELTTNNALFPRQQMLRSQWGLGDDLAMDPGVWLCHQCNDCNARCPRDAKPGDVMQSIRALAVERLATPGFMGKLVGNAARTWPLLLGLPILFWIALIGVTNGLEVPEPTNEKIIHASANVSFVDEAYAAESGSHGNVVTGGETRLVYEEFVPHKLIYGTYFTTAALVLIAIIASGVRFWKLLGRNRKRSGSMLAHLIPVLGEIASHKRFGSCGATSSRRWAHFGVLWGFVGAALTSALLIVAMYVTGTPLPLEQAHPYKILGNISAVLLVVGGIWMVVNRLGNADRAGISKAFDTFFLSVVVLVIATGTLTEIGAFAFPPALAVGLYVVHLGAVLCLFLTFPYSKFSHMVYRSLAMVHERMVTPVAAASGEGTPLSD
ncbi:quinone-interacting membrane-bound oxidoreductase complex subunit QmoC [bacterium]|nr:quinone-interacting membrane-bound oxidoreductase complex subunit QmoC [bacterium]MBU1073502.1 quinone-interacting membrane-bound oxidoreductase complex subunit QmoC [bacterium]MBU1676097.1 quinone-interacting membrane-bound oxidoreductase complex subunit QmoC [bacterium]